MRRQLLFTLLIVLAVTSSWLSFRAQKPAVLPASAEEKRHIDYYLEGVSIIAMDEYGKPQQRLYAQAMEHFEDNDTVLVSQPRLQMATTEQARWQLSSKTGELSSAHDKVMFQGEVTLRHEAGSGPALTLSTETLHYDLQQQVAQTDQPLRIEQGRNSIQATGMTLDLQAQTLTLLSKVQGHYVTAKSL